MGPTRFPFADQQIIGPMLALARCSKSQRIIVLGERSAELVFELHCRGYPRVATTRTCGRPAGQYDVALVDCRQRSMKALEAMLGWLGAFVGSAGSMVIWIDPQEPDANRRLNTILERNGLRAEAGRLFEHGSAVSARLSERLRRKVR
jgi:hypothetical protein